MNLMEVFEIITPDGQTFVISDEHSYAVVDSAGNAMPGFSYQTRRGFQSDHAFVDGFAPEARAVTLILAGSTQSRESYWQARAALISHLRPNRGGALVLRHYREDGTAYDLYCWVNAADKDSDSGFSINQEIELIAFDPFWYSANETSIEFSSSGSSELVFPITFPALFGSDDSFGAAEIIYTGDWPTYPRIEIAGPYSSMMVVHSEAQCMIRLNTQILFGESRIIDLNPSDGKTYIRDGDGVDRMDELMMPDSNLMNFSLRAVGIFDTNDPFSGVSGGINTLVANATGIGAGTSLVVKYKERYLGFGG